MPYTAGKLVRPKSTRYTRHGICLRSVPTFISNYILENPQFSEVTEDKHIEILFKLKEREVKVLKEQSTLLCPYTGVPTDIKEIEKNANKIKWNCFSCDATILSSNNNFSKSNLLCKSCLESKPEIDNKEFLLYTEKFREEVKRVLGSDQKNLIKYIRKNSNK